MKHIILIYILFIVNFDSFGQKNDTWIMFPNQDTTLYGYKNLRGEIKIEPKFTGMTRAEKFDHIIAVSEEKNEKWINYYLTKSGKMVGKDSLCFFDNAVDCESEGFIRFSDKTTQNMGLFNKNGNVVIPAIYNHISNVRNGMIIALKNAEKKFWNQHNHSGCNHFSWSGGQTILIDTLNQVLIENFDSQNALNLYSLEKNTTPTEHPTRQSFLGTNGLYYSFIDYKKEFTDWFTNEFLKNLTKDKLIESCFQNIIWSSNLGWVKSEKHLFVQNNFDMMNNSLMEILNPNTKFSIHMDDLNFFLFEEKEFEKYYNNCYEAKSWQYPVFSLIVTNTNNDNQNHFDFLRTESGYKLISVSLRNVALIL